MIILIDWNQVVISNLMQQIGGQKSSMKLEEDLIRHMALNSLRSYARKYKAEYGKVVVCCDNKKYWRRDIFPLYKANRKKDREASALDWGLIFDTMNNLRNEIKEYLPYIVLDVEGAEADDIIGTLVKVYSPHEKVMIVSSDKDFAQLQKYDNVRQWSPILGKLVKINDPREFVKEHIIKGDRGDGIPNFLSPDDTFVSGGRQKQINTKKLNEWLRQEPERFCTTDTMLRGYKRNQMLVDLDFIPEAVTERIVEAYNNTKPAPRQKMLNYFIEKRLKNLIEVIDEF